MSLITRPQVNIGRNQREQRDDRMFVVAAEDTYAPEQYFKFLPFRRVKVIVLPTPEGSGMSSPRHVVERLKETFLAARQKKQVQRDDEFWVCIDTDHHIGDSHLKGTVQALDDAAQSGFEIAVSNPCFELWLLLHHEDVTDATAFPNADAVDQALKRRPGGYNKTAIREDMFPLSLVPDAIRRARALESNPDDPKGHWPETVGTRVYRLLERILPPTP